VADVTVVAERAAPVRLYPFGLGLGPELLRIEPQSTTRAFDERYSEGANYVVVPAMQPRNNQFVMDWIIAQHRKGAKIMSICNGSLTVAAAGLLDGRRATAHWNAIRQLQKAHPTMQWVQDRRYVADGSIITATGISASVPVTVALVEAIAGREKAERLAQDLGVASWDARHRSSEFQLTTAGSAAQQRSRARCGVDLASLLKTIEIDFELASSEVSGSAIGQRIANATSAKGRSLRRRSDSVRFCRDF
jgi:transcriptional regulator GlxA family with amidase domain